MDSIFFEKQLALLCGQHALNNLLQGPHFQPGELAEIGQRLDEAENAVLDAGSRSRDSNNYNASGFFSVQVIAEALTTFKLEIIPIGSPHMESVKNNPLMAKGFICNKDLHWFVLRRFGQQWFELNSVKKGPELISDLYLSLFLDQLQKSKYQVFVVVGSLPDCEADQVISLCPVQPPPPESKENFLKKKAEEAEKAKTEAFTGRGMRLGGPNASSNYEDEELQKAIKLSVAADDEDPLFKAALEASLDVVEEERSVQLALMQSLENGESGERKRVEENRSSSPNVRDKRQQFLDRFK